MSEPGQPALFELPPSIPKHDPDERYTPSRTFGPLHAELRFTLDVCATAESAKVPRYFSAETNGLEQGWGRERCWCNPPYSSIEPWLRKAWASDADLVAMLLPNWTDRLWWGELVEPWRDSDEPVRIPGLTPHAGFRFRTRFLPGRIAFGTPGDPEGMDSGRPEFGSVLLLWSAE